MKPEIMQRNNGLLALSHTELVEIQGGGGPISEALEWYYKTMGSFYRGLWDGLTGAEPKL
ncbi:MAG: hypothetical protein WBV45_05170 [Lutimonas sp.]